MVFQVAINEVERIILKTAEAVSCSRKSNDRDTDDAT